MEREVLNIVTVGHVDHGKSTIIGRLLYDTNSVLEGTINKVKNICKENGKPFEYAYLLDAFEEEQKQGITIDTTNLQFHTEKRDYVIIDAPGHKEFLKNMISGAANAEAALLIIDANEGIQEQSKRHGYILSLLGIKQVYVVVNKMDLIDYSREKFEKIKQNMSEFLGNLNVNPINFIPVSAFWGENISSKSEKMPWYNGETVLEALDCFKKEVTLSDKPLRFPIQDVYKFDHRRIIVGRVESGSLNAGDEIKIYPSGKTTKIKSIEYFLEKDKDKPIEAGMSVGITVYDEFFNKRGEVITNVNNSPIVSDIIKANIFWMGKNPLVKNKKYKLKLVTQEIECEIDSIDKVIDVTTLKEGEASKQVKTNDVAQITIRTSEKIVFDKFSNDKKLGRFVLVDDYDVSGGGIIYDTASNKELLNTYLMVDDKEFMVDIFDEYEVILPEGTLKEIKGESIKYNVGDSIKVKGKTYDYGDDFDIVSLKSYMVAKIRNKKLIDIVDLDKYQYKDINIIDTKGFSINAKTKEEFKDFIEEHKKLSTLNHKIIEFSNKWLDFSKFRTIKYGEMSK